MTKIDVLKWIDKSAEVAYEFNEIIVMDEKNDDVKVRLVWDNYSDNAELSVDGYNFNIDEYDIERIVTNKQAKEVIEKAFEERKEQIAHEREENEYWGHWNSREDDSMDSRRGLI